MMEGERNEIVFFDVETSIPWKTGQGYTMLEFGAIVVCPRRLVELESYSTLIRPPDLSVVTERSVNCNGITAHALSSAPPFSDVADHIYHLLHGRVWAGHNILAFDCRRVVEAFEEIGRTPPTPKGHIDSLPLLRNTFGKRAGDMKMATLASYFGLGSQKHRSIDDVRMNLEVVKYCSTVLFLETNYPILLQNDILSASADLDFSSSSKNSKTRSQKKFAAEVKMMETISPSPVASSNDRDVLRFSETPNGLRTSIYSTTVAESPSSSKSIKNNTNMTETETGFREEDKLFLEQESQFLEKEFKELSGLTQEPVTDISGICNGFKSISLEQMVREEKFDSPNPSSKLSKSECNSEAKGSENAESEEFLEAHEISTSFLKAEYVPCHRDSQKMILLHKNVPLQMHSRKMKIRYCISRKYFEPTGKRRLSFVVEPTLESCNILKECESLARYLFSQCHNNSEWRPLLLPECGSGQSIPAVRIHILTSGTGNKAQILTDFYKKAPTGQTQKLILPTVDIDKLDELIVAGMFIDADFTFDIYDYQQNAGVRIIARRLTLQF